MPLIQPSLSFDEQFPICFFGVVRLLLRTPVVNQASDRDERVPSSYQMSGKGLGRVKMIRPREPGDAWLNLACYCNCEPESTWFARPAVSDLTTPMHTPMRTPHVLIAAMRGFTPRMFMTRVRL